MTLLLVAVLLVSMLGILHAYLFYPLTLAFISRMKSPVTIPEGPQDDSDLPTVSIIVAAYNEEKVIAARLENALSLDYPNDKLEILIASDGSDDATVSIVTASALLNPQVKLLDYKERRGKVNVLNDAVGTALGDVLVFSDANVSFRSDALRKLVRPFSLPEIGCVCGRLIFESTSEDANAEGFYWKLETWMKTREGKLGSLLGANGAIFAMRSSAWEPCPSDTLVEDFFIPMRLLQKRWRVIYEPGAIATEEYAPTISDEFVRRVRIGAGDFQALSRLGSLLLPNHGFTAYAFFSHKVLRWVTPFLMLFTFQCTALLSFLGYTLFQLLLFAQFMFYALALLGLYWQPSGPARTLVALPTQFVFMNAALLLGFIRWLTGAQRVTWKRTRRLAETSCL